MAEQTKQTEQNVSTTGITRLADLVDTQTRHRSGAPMGHPEFDRLVRTIWRLRQSDGCPWDKAQTHDSITKNMVEEAYEAVEAIKEGSSEHLQEELGDVLEQVLLHSQIESDDGGFDIDDVCRALNEKLVRRHPHVFGPEAGNAHDADAALDAWDSVKAAERANEEDRVHTEGLLDSVPYSLPALMQAQKLSKRVAKLGFDWDSVHMRLKRQVPKLVWKSLATSFLSWYSWLGGTESMQKRHSPQLIERCVVVGRAWRSLRVRRASRLKTTPRCLKTCGSRQSRKRASKSRGKSVESKASEIFARSSLRVSSLL